MTIYQPLDCQPVFLIGAARSGTKFLRNLIAADSQVREIPFDVNFLWRRGNESFPHDGLPEKLASPEVIADLRERLPRLAKASGGSIFLEKTVSNALRIAFIRKVFPEAKFIHLIRDGKSVVESVHRVWDEPTSLKYKLQKLRYFPVTDFRYGWWFLTNTRKRPARVWGPRYEGIDQDLSTLSRLEVCGRQWLRCVDCATQELEQVPEDHKREVRYENLVMDRAVSESIAEFLDISDPTPILQHYDSVVEQDKIGKWQGNWDQTQRQRLQSIIGHRLDTLGYNGLIDNA